MILPLSLLALSLASTPALAAKPGDIEYVGDTLVSAMMMFLGNDEKVYMMDKAEGNAAQINGHPAWASVWDINTKSATLMDFASNAFCASGMHLPNGSFATFGGNGAIGPGGNIGSVFGDGTGAYDETYKNYDGGKSIRILNPCKGAISASDAQCQWFDDAKVLAMQKRRWYSTAEALADGTIVLIGGFQNGGYINRNYPNNNPDDGSENSFEFYPSRGPATPMPFMRRTSGLNSYAHAFLMPSGKMLVQANYSTIMWDYNTAEEIPLPDMPNNIVRVYPASGAVAMLPLTPANNYTPTVLFCGGQDMDDTQWGNFSWPFIDTWNRPAVTDCQRITPEPTDGSSPTYEKDDDLLEGRTMGQFIILPTGKLVVLNGAINGTAGYSDKTLLTTSYSDMPFGMSLASGPVGTPALYDPTAPKGSRWSNKGLGSSNVPRLYHSSALLLPDASILIAGSNPSVDVNISTIFPTTYKAEQFYPPYFAAKTRPQPQNVPMTLTYGGKTFDITVPASSYSGNANDAAGNTTVVLIRPGWTTHAMNMGQRFLQLNNTYTVNSDGSYLLHTSQVPPNANLLTPGPCMLFVVVNGIPSKATMITVGNGNFGTQPVSPVEELPASVRLDTASGTADGSTTSSGNSGNSNSNNSDGDANESGGSSTGMLVGGIVAAVAAIGIIGAIVGICLARRRRAARSVAAASAGSYPMSTTNFPKEYEAPYGGGPGQRASDSSAFVPLQSNASNVSLHAPYQDQAGRDSFAGHRSEASFSGQPMEPSYAGAGHYPSHGHDQYDPYYDQSRR